jgi:23S rRNA (guanine2445-N2)-methyltransferase / 23S rRNA (guanine2069-N7)-methyltransferase
MDFLALAPLGAADLLAAEIAATGATDVRERAWGVTFSGTLECAYRACLWSRTASRVLRRLHEAPAGSPEALYAAAREVDWGAHLGPAATLAVDFDAVRSAITHTHYGALKVKDAIVDQLREARGERPTVDTARPSVRVNVRVVEDRAVFALDLSGEALHRRGYRGAGVPAPLKENLAAALLLRAGWPEAWAGGGAFLDPMCGSGTLPIEAALIAGDIAPGLLREYWGFAGWAGHDAGLWQRLVGEALTRRERGRSEGGRIVGTDHDARAVRAAHEALGRAGLTRVVHVERRELADAVPPAAGGLLLVNPPYGERLGDVDQLRGLYAELGQVLRERFVGWRAAVFTGNPALGRELKIQARRTHRFYNGAIEARLLRFEIAPEHFVVERPPGRLPTVDPAVAEQPGARMFANRLKKNLDQLGKWARREGVACYRVYDADMPEYAFAIDLYGDGEGARFAYVQEYEAPPTVAEDRVRARRAEVVAVLPATLGLDAGQVYFRTRRKRRGTEQYVKLDTRREFHEVREQGLKFLVNFTDYLDTGLFLDHRLTRAMLRERAAGKRFLNLFAYTGTATVYAAAGGASSTTTVDLSRTYLDWAQANLALNGFEGREHVLVHADALEWVRTAPAGCFDLVFLDPPTFSNSKRMSGTLDVQRDHVQLLTDVGRLVAPGGLLVFSTNFTRFRLDAEALPEFEVEDVTRATIPRDFERNPRIHRCFLLRRRDPSAASVPATGTSGSFG